MFAKVQQHIVALFFLGGAMVLLSACGANAEIQVGLPAADGTPLAATRTALQNLPNPHPPVVLDGPPESRGYQTTPVELAEIKRKADDGIEPYATAVEWTIAQADEAWDFELQARETCPDSQHPAWNDNGAGTPILYAKALAYHLTGEERYAAEVRDILQRIMTEVETIDLDDGQCPLNFAWGTPELVAAADLIETFWHGMACTGPLSTLYADTTIGTGTCKALFQNWLVKNPYYIVSHTAVASTSNWGAAATNMTAYVADYLWDRGDVLLIHRLPRQVNSGEELALTPAEAYELANQLALDRMNGYRVSYGSIKSCDRFLLNWEQNSAWLPVKSQITENGIIPDDARRTEYCNISHYDSAQKHNYPQLHLGNNIQQCELMLRRGDRRCYDNVDNTDLPDYTFIDPYGLEQTTHLRPGRGSIERAINAIIVDAGISWQHDPALEVAYRYYYNHHTMPGYEQWADDLNRRRARCLNHLCFGMLTHGFASDEVPQDPPVVPPPGAGTAVP